MSLVGSRWSSNLAGKLAAKGFIGARLHLFTDAVGNGSQQHTVGKPFATQDVGTIPGIGAGTGTGITVGGAAASSNIFALASAAGFVGRRLQDICDACGQTLQDEYGQATLTSNHTPVFLGVGTIVQGSIAVIGPLWGTQIQSLGTGENFIGQKWPDFALALGAGQAQEVLAHGTGTVTIVGGPTSPTPVPGAGAGVGVVS